jgi:hypothetical protein
MKPSAKFRVANEDALAVTCARREAMMEAGRIGASEQQSSLSVVAGQFGGTEELGASVRCSS